jgi:hypothetical protein
VYIRAPSPFSGEEGSHLAGKLQMTVIAMKNCFRGACCPLYFAVLKLRIFVVLILVLVLLFKIVQFILEQLCDIICPTKPEQAYMMVLNKAHTQEEFIRGSMTKNPYSSLEIGPLMRDVKNKICHQLELLGLIEDDYGMELLVAGNIIALDLSVAQVYEQVWRKAHQQAASSVVGSSILAVAAAATTGRECPPMTITYRLQVCNIVLDSQCSL